MVKGPSVKWAKHNRAKEPWAKKGQEPKGKMSQKGQRPKERMIGPKGPRPKKVERAMDPGPIVSKGQKAKKDKGQ
jgi:hypothetical protein